MKKTLLFVAVATLFACSCVKEITPADTSEKNVFTFQASIEQLATKADITESYGFNWTTGDKIGLYLNNSWDDKHQPFTLVGDGGSSSGSFAWDYGDFSDDKAILAYFPWEGLGSDKNNYSGGSMYYKLHDAYDGYTSGKMVTPLVGRVTRTGGDYDPIAFEHAGAAVQVTINNLPAGARSMGLNAGQQVNGTYHLVPDSAPNPVVSDNLTFDLAWGGSVNPNSVWLKFTPTASERPFTFVFPVPALVDDSDLSFQLYDENDVLVWSRTASDQDAINHGDILVMPALDITPYKQFKSVSATWSLIGQVNGTNWNADLPMVTDGKLCIAKGVSLEANAELKVRSGGDWGDYGTGNFGASTVNTSKSNNTTTNSENIKVTAAGLYDIIFNSSDSAYGDFGAHEIRVVTSKCPYPSAPVTMAMDGDMSEWAAIPGTVAATSASSAIQQVKAYADDDYVYVYVKRTNEGRFSDLWTAQDDHGEGYYYFYFDLDGDSDTGTYDRNGKWEIGPFLYLFGNTSGTFITNPTGNAYGMTSLSGVICNGNATANYVEVEVAFPRENFPTISSETVRVSVYGNKDAGQVETSFTIPPAAPISISIDGDMTDWAKVPGSSASDITLKVWNDDTNFYLYTSCTPGTREKELWGYKQGYFYYDFDLDNDAETGSYTNEAKNYEAVLLIYPFGGTKYDSGDPENTPVREVADPVIISSSDGGFTTSGIVFKPVLTFESSTFTLFEIEFLMPRANFNTQVNAGDVIKIFNWRSKDGGSTTFTYTVQ